MLKRRKNISIPKAITLHIFYDRTHSQCGGDAVNTATELLDVSVKEQPYAKLLLSRGYKIMPKTAVDAYFTAVSFERLSLFKTYIFQKPYDKN